MSLTLPQQSYLTRRAFLGRSGAGLGALALAALLDRDGRADDPSAGPAPSGPTTQRRHAAF
jgi:hypothetical protein